MKLNYAIIKALLKYFPGIAASKEIENNFKMYHCLKFLTFCDLRVNTHVKHSYGKCMPSKIASH